MNRERVQVWIGAGIIAAAVAAAYANTLQAPFIFDDVPAITENPALRHPWSMANLLPPAGGSGQAGRPVASLSLALNYACGGVNVRGYHLVNLAIHALAALALFGLIRRMLAAWARPSTLAALAVALVWAMHPLLTESVTCIVQRNESMMGLFYLLTLYSFLRYVNPTRSAFGGRAGAVPPPGTSLRAVSKAQPGGGTAPALPQNEKGRLWAALSFAACLLGMLTKEVMVTAPIVVLLYDRTFVAGTFAAAWRRRKGYYLGLAATWLVLGGILVHQGGSRGTAAGFGLGVTPWQYLLRQCWAVVHYIRLAFWPYPLVLDYGTKVETQLSRVLPQAILLIALLAGSAWLLFRGRAGAVPPPGTRQDVARRAWGFAGACFFLILAPSSSILPLISQTVAEHRMYLPLAAMVGAVVLTAQARLGRIALAGCFVLAAGLALLTVRRNADYGSDFGMWLRNIAALPDNPRPYNNVGLALINAGRPREAIPYLEKALTLNPEFGAAENDLGLAEVRAGEKGAEAHFERAIRLGQEPAATRARNNLGLDYVYHGQTQAAIDQYREALKADPTLAQVENNYGIALVDLGKPREALAHYEHAMALSPKSPEIQVNYGLALIDAGRTAEGMARLEKALHMDEDDPAGRRSFGRGYLAVGLTRARKGQLPAAIALLRLSVHANPDSVEAWSALGDLLGQAHRAADSLQAYAMAERVAPENPVTHYNLANVLRARGRFAEAIPQYEEALRLHPGFVQAENNLGATLAQAGRLEEAERHIEEVLRLNPKFPGAQAMLDSVRKALARR